MDRAFGSDFFNVIQASLHTANSFFSPQTLLLGRSIANQYRTTVVDAMQTHFMCYSGLCKSRADFCLAKLVMIQHVTLPYQNLIDCTAPLVFSLIRIILREGRMQVLGMPLDFSSKHSYKLP